jgi:hypothetical protein
MAESNSKSNLLQTLQRTNALFVILILLFVGFIITKNPILGILAGITFISIFIVDIASGAEEHGWKEELQGIGIAAVVAVVFWLLLIIAMDSFTPISGIVTCSMLPRFDRGDMIVLHGVRNFSEINAPTIEMTPKEFRNFSDMAKEYATTFLVGQTIMCGGDDFKFLCSNDQCQRLNRDGSSLGNESVCTVGLEFKGQVYYENYSSDIIVYAPKPYGYNTSIQGMDIIHRVFAKIKVGEKYYFLTKGDNNQVFDAYWLNIISEEDVKGKVALRLPFLGYFKLFITPQFYSNMGADPQGCEKIYERAKL